MRKFIIALLLFTALILSACGNNAENDNVEDTGAGNDQAENEVNESEQAEDEGEVETETEDLMEFATNDQYDTYIRYLEKYKDIGTYVSDVSDDIGFNQIEFDGFHVDFVFKLLEDQRDGKEVIGFIAETQNDSGDIVAFNVETEILTSNQEQTEVLQGLGQTEHGESTRGLLLAPIEDGVPDSFVVKFARPFRDIEGGEEVGHLGEEIEMEFHLQE